MYTYLTYFGGEGCTLTSHILEGRGVHLPRILLRRGKAGEPDYFTYISIFSQFYLTSLRGKEYFAKEPEPGVFGLGARKIYQEPEPLGKKN